MAHLSPQALLAHLDALGIRPRPSSTPPSSRLRNPAPVKAGIPGAHSKNLFVKDKKGRFFLITARDETAIDLKRAHAAIGASGRLSFGSAEQLRARLGVEPGSVTPFAIVNDLAGEVTMILDANLMDTRADELSSSGQHHDDGDLPGGSPALPALHRPRALILRLPSRFLACRNCQKAMSVPSD